MPRPATGAPSRAQERGIEQVWAIRRADDKHVRPTTVTARHPRRALRAAGSRFDPLRRPSRRGSRASARPSRARRRNDTRPRIACPLEHAPHVRLRLANVHVQ